MCPVLSDCCQFILVGYETQPYMQLLLLTTFAGAVNL
jgi:hypothetical protein